MTNFIKTIPAGTYLYHATPYHFEQSDIKPLMWFTTNPEQARNHASYKHFGCPKARLLVYKTKVPLKIIELSLSLHKLEYFKVFGRELFAKSLIEDGHYAGWMMHEAQTEFTLCNYNDIEAVGIRNTYFDTKIVYSPLAHNCEYKWGIIEVKQSRSWWRRCCCG